MSIWIRKPIDDPRADTYEDVVSTGVALLTSFDLSSIPEDDRYDALVVQRLAIAEARGGVVYYGVPSRQFVVDLHDGTLPFSLGAPPLVTNFVTKGKPTIS